MTGAEPDTLCDDQSLIIETGRGPILLLGCAHAGLINILTSLRDQHNLNQWHAVIGGTHLGPVSEHQFSRTVAALKDFSIERLCLSHCTGLLRSARLFNEFPGKVHFAAVGFDRAQVSSSIFRGTFSCKLSHPFLLCILQLPQGS